MKNENVKLRLDYFFKKGLKLVNGDKYQEVAGHVNTVNDLNKNMVNDPCPMDCNRFVISLAPRKNTGEQPCDGGLPVEVKGNNGFISTLQAKHASWERTEGKSSNGAYYALLTWKPDLDALIAMQIEHDKKQAIPEPATAEQLKEFDSLCEEDAINPKQGDKVRIEHKSSMDEISIIQDFTFMFENDREICVIDDQGDGMFISQPNFIAYHPLKSELEILKEKQVKSVAQALATSYCNATDSVKHWETFKSDAQYLQDNGMLAEIASPLDK